MHSLSLVCRFPAIIDFSAPLSTHLYGNSIILLMFFIFPGVIECQVLCYFKHISVNFAVNSVYPYICNGLRVFVKFLILFFETRVVE